MRRYECSQRLHWTGTRGAFGTGRLFCPPDACFVHRTKTRQNHVFILLDHRVRVRIENLDLDLQSDKFSGLARGLIGILLLTRESQ